MNETVTENPFMHLRRDNIQQQEVAVMAQIVAARGYYVVCTPPDFIWLLWKNRHGRKGKRISVDHLTEAALSGVLAALKANDMRPELFPGPILVGIIAWPELSKFGERAAGNIPGAQPGQ